MDDDISEKFNQLSEIFNEKFQSPEVQQQNQEYIEQLKDQLKSYQAHTNEQVQTIIDQKIDEIQQLYGQYRQEVDENYAKLIDQRENNNSLTVLNDQIENFNIYCQSNTLEQRVRLNASTFTNNQIAEKIQVEYVPFDEVPPTTRITPLKTVTKERSASIHSFPPSSRSSPHTISLARSPVPDESNEAVSKDGLRLKPLTGPLKQQPFLSPKNPARTTATEHGDSPKSSTRIYIGRHEIFTPIYIDKDREVYNEIEREKITEYSIDSIPIPQDDDQEQSSATNSVNDSNMTLVRAYKVLIKQENDFQLPSRTFSHRGVEQSTDINNSFHLQAYDQSNFSTILFEKCETLYNCMSSSSKRNELVIYNSKLKVLMILQHDDNQTQCRHRFYLQWPNTLSANVSDITYCQKNDHFLISTWDTCHLYLFNRHSLSITDLGRLQNDLELRRIHSYEQTIYCILGNNYLLEYQLDEQNSKIKFIQRIKLYNSKGSSKDTVYHLLDITCDKNYLYVVYPNEQGQIHLQSIHRQTKKFHNDVKLDEKHPINQAYIRIESMNNNNGNFIYLNGAHKHLKAIDFNNSDHGITISPILQQNTPTNLCVLHDGRLVILHEAPYFLSIHGLNNRQEGY